MPFPSSPSVITPLLSWLLANFKYTKLFHCRAFAHFSLCLTLHPLTSSHVLLFILWGLPKYHLFQEIFLYYPIWTPASSFTHLANPKLCHAFQNSHMTYQVPSLLYFKMDSPSGSILEGNGWHSQGTWGGLNKETLYKMWPGSRDTNKG